MDRGNPIYTKLYNGKQKVNSFFLKRNDNVCTKKNINKLFVFSLATLRDLDFRMRTETTEGF